MKGASQPTHLYIALLLFSHWVVSDSLQPHGVQHARLPCPSPSPRVCSDSCPLSWWCHPTISSSVIPFSSCPQSFPALGSFPRSELFASGGQSIGVSASASVLPMNIQGLLFNNYLSRKKKPWYVTFANYHGVNTPTDDDFELTMWFHRHGVRQRHKIYSWELV